MKTENKAMSKEELNIIIVETNQAIFAVKKASKTVFLLLKNASDTMNRTDYKTYINSIDLDKSTITKIEKILDNSVVMNNLESLPVSWGTLYELAQIDTDTLITKITDGSINKKSTKEAITTIKKALNQTATPETGKTEPSAKQATDSEENEKSAKQPTDEFTFTMKESAKTHTKEVKKLLEQLKKYFEIPSDLEQFFNEVVA
jgi:hypothetical protein